MNTPYNNNYFQTLLEIEKAKELLKRHGYIVSERNICTTCGQYVQGVHYCSGKPIKQEFQNEYKNEDIGKDSVKYADM